jgi:UDP:flavonoid glycosyltransferase YjiC (YdhE family)
VTRVAWFGYPARSHTVPSLSLVREQVKRGAHITYYSTEKFRPSVEQTGAQFVPYGSIDDSLVDPSGVEGPGSVVAHARRLADAARLVMPELMSSVGRPDLVVFDASAYWGGLIGRQMRTPSAAFVTTFALTRAMLGLLGVLDNDVLDVLVPVADLKIVCTSRFLQPSGRFFDDSHVFVGPLLEHRPQEGVRIQPEGPRPLAYLSLGTIFNRDRELFRAIAARLSAAGWQVAVSTGNAAGHDPEDWPPYVRAWPFVNQLAALRLADLAVTHGGMGSISEIMACGVPSIIHPRAADQFLVARRAASLGAAVVVDDIEDFRGAWDAAIVRVRAERSSMVAAAARIAQSFSNVTPIGVAADRVLQLAGTTAIDAILN